MLCLIGTINDSRLAAAAAGYITIDKHTNKRLFYYFATSQGDPKRDPVVLWMNGKPLWGLNSPCLWL